jgi:chemotaxis protein MotB
MNRFLAATITLITIFMAGCVTQSKYDKLQTDYDALKAENAGLRGEVSSASGKIGDLDKTLTETRQQKDQMERALSELKQREEEAKTRINEFRDLVTRFKSLIDAETLLVKIVNGRMVVAMATDVLFPSGSATLSKEGQDAVNRVATVLATIKNRDFQIEGHTDNIPINSSRFPSNWELASARAINVVRGMVAGGVPAPRISAASFADTRPVADNGTAEGRKANRRIEIVVVPDLSGLPGFEELSKMTSGAQNP